MKGCCLDQQGNLSLEQALLLGAAVLCATVALPAFFRGMGGYLDGFTETSSESTIVSNAESKS